MEIFKIIPDNFFSLLSSKNKSVYAGCIMEAFKIYEEGSILGIDKKIVVEVLTDYLDKEMEEILDMEIDEDADKPSSRDKANFILRRMEECGWIDIDVTNDYMEVLNFRDYAITIIEALLQIEPQIDDYADTSQKEYRGYIYTIYSLLTNPMNIEYGVLMEQVYRNTKLFIRELRKLDSRLKDYIKSIVDRTEIKDLMESLIDYKVELVDKAYHRLKTSDNVNKYRLEIVNKLDSFLADPAIMEQIAIAYRVRYANIDDAYRRASRDITEMIDIFSILHQCSHIIPRPTAWCSIANHVYFVEDWFFKISTQINDCHSQIIHMGFNTVIRFLRYPPLAIRIGFFCCTIHHFGGIFGIAHIAWQPFAWF